MDAPQRDRRVGVDAANLEMLLAYVAANDVPCPVCGYNLRALTTDLCPECGQRFQLGVGSTSAWFGLFLLFLAPMIMTAGLGLFFITAIAAFGRWPMWPEDWGFYLICLAGVISGVLSLLFYRARQRLFFRRRRRIQLSATALVWFVETVIVVTSLKFGS